MIYGPAQAMHVLNPIEFELCQMCEFPGGMKRSCKQRPPMSMANYFQFPRESPMDGINTASVSSKPEVSNITETYSKESRQSSLYEANSKEK